VKLLGTARGFLTPIFIKWLLVGSTSLLLDIVVFTYSYYLIEIVFVSNFIAAMISTSFNYLAHYFWTFDSVSAHRNTLMRYFLNILFLWVTSSLIIEVLISNGLGEVSSKVLSMCILLPFNFFVLRKYVYFNPSEH
jgi:putative flippase GtrA